MARIIDFRHGLTYHVEAPNSQFVKDLKKIFRVLNVPSFDNCCASTTDVTIRPVSFNTTAGTITYFDGTGWVEATQSNITSVTTSITAHAGGGQGSAVALTTEYNNVTIVATAGDSVKLPTAVTGTVVIVRNNGVAPLAVFPFTADSIDGGTVNASISIPVGETVVFTAKNTVDWVSNRHQAKVASAINSTNTATAVQIAGGIITSTSAAATAITLPSATALATQIGAVQGTTFDLVVDNSAGANIVTVTASGTITAGTAVLTGGATLTVASGVTSLFKIIFTSPTVAKIFRIA